MNNQRDGFMRYTINTSVVNYWPNRFGNIPPSDDVNDSTGAQISFEQKVVGIKKRLNAPKFKEHYNQAQLFINSLSRTSHMGIVKCSTRVPTFGQRNYI
jgi:catalase